AYLGSIAKTEYYTEQNGAACAAAKASVQKLCVAIDTAVGATEALRRALDVIDSAQMGEKARALACRALANSEMRAVRCAADALEMQVPQSDWPIPDYCELLFDL
ncbi:MAG: glutamine synthetase type III, partial [Ruthenibacterium sp.]